MSSSSSLKINECFQNSDLKAIFEDKQQLFDEKPLKHLSEKKHVCFTCKKEIDLEISRVLVLRDKDGGPRLFCFHFFFPCWDFNQLCQTYPDLIIDSAGFSIPENISMNNRSIQDLQKNLEFWN